MTCLRVEDQLHQMTELCPVLTGWRRSVRNFRNGFGILDRRIVVRAMHDDHVQSWNNENVMSPISSRRIDSGKRDFREMNTAIVHPPEILVTAAIRCPWPATTPRSFRDMVVLARDRVQKLKTAGKSAKDIAASKPFADLDATWGKGFFNGDVFVQMVYSTL